MPENIDTTNKVDFIKSIGMLFDENTSLKKQLEESIITITAKENRITELLNIITDNEKKLVSIKKLISTANTILNPVDNNIKKV